jgi:predicted short-subunit dehydrogenase-like oxidoreductase (DUF2520 family)
MAPRRNARRRAATGVVIVGRGKVGRALAKALASIGEPVALYASRRALPAALLRAELVVLAVRDDQIAAAADRIGALARARRGRPDASARRASLPAVVHCAGARGPDELACLRDLGMSVGQMHPLLSFAAPARPPTLTGAAVVVRGDARAVRLVRALLRRLRMIPRSPASLDEAAYHAAASTLANGAAALAEVATSLLVSAGLDRRVAPRMLGPLLRSVGENLGALGLPDALTGPTRRGDLSTLERHLALIDRAHPEARTLYLELVRFQLDLARRLPDAAPADLDTIEAWRVRKSREFRAIDGAAALPKAPRTR